MIGRTVSHYSILEKIGEGGMGVVYKAQDTLLKRFVALKFLPPDLMRDPEAADRFVQEARAASALEHNNICSVHEIGDYEGQTFIVMGLYEGETLKERISRGAIPTEEAVSIACQIALGLSKAHAVGIIHRDIKPANIVITKEGVVKILDFGLAKAPGRTIITKSGTTLGTAAYMSPEQVRGEQIDARSDIWSLGVTLYEMLAGTRPFKSDYEQGLAYLIVSEKPEPLEDHVARMPARLGQIVKRALEKRVSERFSTAEEMFNELVRVQDDLREGPTGSFTLRLFLAQIRKPVLWAPLIALLVLMIAFLLWYVRHRAKIHWAEEIALPQIERLIAEREVLHDFEAPYQLAEAVEEILPDDPRLASLFAKCSVTLSVTTDPPGARVSVMEYGPRGGVWKLLGETPLTRQRLPVNLLLWKFEAEGFDTVVAVAPTWQPDTTTGFSHIPCNMVRVLPKREGTYANMVLVPATQTEAGTIGEFFMDRYEVTNKQFKEFISGGGYREPRYWQEKFFKEGKVLSREEALREFVDQTGQQGPSGWQAGDYPAGEGDYPVGGISWYEAAAYATFAGKTLPTSYQWLAARGGYVPSCRYLGTYEVAAQSNFAGKGPAPVGRSAGTSAYGAYDMAGNVREWCWNESSTGRVTWGGAWDENLLKFIVPGSLPPMDRSAQNGFRCALMSKTDAVSDVFFGPMPDNSPNDAHAYPTATDPVFQALRNQFTYDAGALNPEILSREESSEGWILEKVALNATYDHERIIAYLFLPKNSATPFQTLVYYPCEMAFLTPTSGDLAHYYEVPTFLSFVIRSGRAVLFPVYKGTFERGDVALAPLLFTDSTTSRVYSDHVIRTVMDLKRCLDYLESRQDIDKSRIAYYGMGRGAMLGGIIPAVDSRLKASVLLGASIDTRGREEVRQTSYLPRVKIPTLVLAPKYGNARLQELSLFLKQLGTPPNDKRLKICGTSQSLSQRDVLTETLNWLDMYLGTVKH